MEIELNEYLDRVVEKDANQLHLCHSGVMISPWSEEEIVGRQTITDNDVFGDKTEVLKADSASFIFFVALLAFIGQLASIFIGKLYLCLKKEPELKMVISRPPVAGPRPALQAGG